MKWRVPGQKVEQRKLGQRWWKKTVKHVDWIGRMPWIVVDEVDRDDWWPRWVWVGECFFWLSRVVLDKIQRAVKRLCVCDSDRMWYVFYSKTGCNGMGMCCKKKTTIGWRNEVKGARPKSRPKNSWTDIVVKDCQACKLDREDAMDRKRWRKQIRDDWWSR